MVWFPTEIDDPWFPPKLQSIDNIIFADQDTQVPILSCYIYNTIYCVYIIIIIINNNYYYYIYIYIYIYLQHTHTHDA